MLSLASVARGGMVVVVFEFWENSDFRLVGLDGGDTDGTVRAVRLKLRCCYGLFFNWDTSAMEIA